MKKLKWAMFACVNERKMILKVFYDTRDAYVSVKLKQFV